MSVRTLVARGFPRDLQPLPGVQVTPTVNDHEFVNPAGNALCVFEATPGRYCYEPKAWHRTTFVDLAARRPKVMAEMPAGRDCRICGKPAMLLWLLRADVDEMGWCGPFCRNPECPKGPTAIRDLTVPEEA